MHVCAARVGGTAAGAAAVIALCADQSGTLLIEMNLDASESLGEPSAGFNYLRRRGVHSKQAAAAAAAVLLSPLASDAGKHSGGWRRPSTPLDKRSSPPH